MRARYWATEIRILGTAHFIFAALFFGTLIYFSLALFAKTKARGRLAGQKVMRNRIYRGCAYVMAGCILRAFAYFVLPLTPRIAVGAYSPVIDWNPLPSLPSEARGSSRAKRYFRMNDA